jgi:hypothetical protein
MPHVLASGNIHSLAMMLCAVDVLQAYFAYDAHKSGGVTVSHLRFGPQPIASSYLVGEADYLGVHLQSYLTKYDCLSRLKPGGVLVLNATWKSAEVRGWFWGQQMIEMAAAAAAGEMAGVAHCCQSGSAALHLVTTCHTHNPDVKSTIIPSCQAAIVALFQCI